jgi:hypothetical protein
MTVIFPIIELIDRYSIACLKFKKTQANGAELDFYTKQITGLDLSLVEEQMLELEQVHKEIWSLESQLKSGLEAELSLEEIGRRAIKIRDWNHRRIAIKNTIADMLAQDNIRDIKREHLSE